jgi:hypothetical protein
VTSGAVVRSWSTAIGSRPRRERPDARRRTTARPGRCSRCAGRRSPRC